VFVDLRAQWELAAPPSDYVRRQAVTAGIIASWSLVVAVPLFAAVGFQSEISVPPVRTDPSHQLVYPQWTPPPWDTQYTRKFPVPTPDFVPRVLTSSSPIALWPQPDWPAQTTLKTPIPDAVAADNPPIRGVSPWTAISQWPQPDWPSQTTKKTAIPNVPLVAKKAYPWAAISRWDMTIPVPLSSTYGTQSSAVVISQPTPYRNHTNTLVGTWPQPTWGTQVTRKTVIPDVPLVPFSRAAFQGIDRWDPLIWDTQVTRKFPVPSQAEQVDNPPPYNIDYQVYNHWFNRPITALWQPLNFRDGPSVAPPGDQPPVRSNTMEDIHSTWIPPAPQPVFGWRLINTPFIPHINRAWLFTVHDAWMPPWYDTRRRPVFTPSGVIVINNPPFTARRPNLSVIDTTWIPLTLPSQRSPLTIWPGVDNPPQNDQNRRRLLDIVVRTWDTISDPVRPTRQLAPRGIVFRRTLSAFGTGVGHRQPHGWS
jgi:hypothetical protein